MSSSMIPLPVLEFDSSESQGIGCSTGLCKGITGYSIVCVDHMAAIFILCLPCVFEGVL